MCAWHASDSAEVWESKLGMSNLTILEGLLLLSAACSGAPWPRL